MKNIWKKLEQKMEDYNIKKKLRIFYIGCVLIPLILTDSVIIYIIIHSEQKTIQHEMENTASAIQYNLSSSFENAATNAKNIYMNEDINNFLNQQFEDPLDYFNNHKQLMRGTLFESSIKMDNSILTMYSDNETIVNGGNFARLSTERESKWYRYLQDTEQKMCLYFYYDDSKSPVVEAKRKAIFLQKMDFYGEKEIEKILKLEMDYGKLVRSMVKMNYGVPVYVCSEGKILLSNAGYTSVGTEFDTVDKLGKAGFVKDLTIYGMDLQIVVMEPEQTALMQIMQNIPVILLLITINIVLPLFLMGGINKSFTERLKELSLVFEGGDDEELIEVENVRGKDEIGSLMGHYNRMVVRIKELIQTVYKDKLRQQEMDLARRNAELLALHSQSNPHFLFNALESIRMHSILKKEFETADMVEKLAVMVRQNVEWGTDLVEVKEEIDFVKAYLGLQKYRFGERLSYKLEVEENCEMLQIPKLTIVTFVENACVHGIESKTTSGWVFVRIDKKDDFLRIEIEDTGEGMEEKYVQELVEKMGNANIELLKDKGRVGIINACLRLKMVTEGTVKFELESEQGIGTVVRIWIPMRHIK